MKKVILCSLSMPIASDGVFLSLCILLSKGDWCYFPHIVENSSLPTSPTHSLPQWATLLYKHHAQFHPKYLSSCFYADIFQKLVKFHSSSNNKSLTKLLYHYDGGHTFFGKSFWTLTSFSGSIHILRWGQSPQNGINYSCILWLKFIILSWIALVMHISHTMMVTKAPQHPKCQLQLKEVIKKRKVVMLPPRSQPQPSSGDCDCHAEDQTKK